MRRLIFIALGLSLIATADARAVVFPPVEPPPPPTRPPDPFPTGPGTLRVKERFDPSKGMPIEGHHSFATITRLASGQRLPDQPLPVDMGVPRGRFRVTSYWRTGSGAGTLDPPSNYCSKTVKVKSGFRNNLFVRRNANGCSIKLATKRKCKAKPTQTGKKRRCRKVRKVIRPKPVTPNPTNPAIPCCKTIPTIRISPLGHDYGQVAIGSTSPPVTFTLKNISATDKGPMGIDLNFDSQDYIFSADACTGVTLSPEQECTFDLSFEPIVAGFSVDNLIPVYPGGNGGFAVGVRGTGF